MGSPAAVEEGGEEVGGGRTEILNLFFETSLWFKMWQGFENLEIVRYGAKFEILHIHA